MLNFDEFLENHTPHTIDELCGDYTVLYNTFHINLTKPSNDRMVTFVINSRVPGVGKHAILTLFLMKALHTDDLGILYVDESTHVEDMDEQLSKKHDILTSFQPNVDVSPHIVFIDEHLIHNTERFGDIFQCLRKHSVTMYVFIYCTGTKRQHTVNRLIKSYTFMTVYRVCIPTCTVNTLVAYYRDIVDAYDKRLSFRAARYLVSVTQHNIRYGLFVLYRCINNAVLVDVLTCQFVETCFKSCYIDVMEDKGNMLKLYRKPNVLYSFIHDFNTPHVPFLVDTAFQHYTKNKKTHRLTEHLLNNSDDFSFFDTLSIGTKTMYWSEFIKARASSLFMK
uniref:Uncharacterized protein n=1 Tax=viral metagenome TaxID=1070528 RepID=A0A6C0CPT1_9ZZZZ